MTNPLKLVLSNGSFAVLVAGPSIMTCYTDYTGTSRSDQCPIGDLVEFAEGVLKAFGRIPPTETETEPCGVVVDHC